jgi:hypothetical protein
MPLRDDVDSLAGMGSPTPADAVNSPKNVLARAISRLGNSTQVPGWSVTATPSDDQGIFRQVDESGRFVYPSAGQLAEKLMAGEPLTGQYAKAISSISASPVPESGWTDKDNKQLGRDPRPFELSEAGKARDASLLDRQLLSDALTKPGALNSLSQDRAAKEGRRYGESGWLGALQNREYLAGKAVLGGQTFGDAAYSQFFDIDPVKGKDGETGYHHPTLGWVADSSWNPLTPNNKNMQTPLGAALTVAAFPGGAAMKYFTHYLPRAADRADVLAAANKVERILPAGTDRAEGNRLIEQTAKAAEPNFDDVYREKYGEWPSYALSSAATFGNGLIDPTLVATGPAARVAAMAGKGLQAASKSAAAPMIRRLMNAYGTSMLNSAGPLAKYPILHAAAKEAIEELPFNAGLMTALGPGVDMMSGEVRGQGLSDQPGDDIYNRPHTPGFGPDGTSMFGGGKNRTDLMREVKDASGNVIGYGHESDEDFKKRLAENRAQGAALRQGTQGLLQQIENSKTPRRPISPVIMSVMPPPF